MTKSPRDKVNKDRQTAEARLRDALAIMSDGIAIYDPEGRLEFCNDCFRRIHGYSEAETELYVATYGDLGKLDAANSTVDHEPLSFTERLAQLHQDGMSTIIQHHDNRTYERRQYVTPSGGLLSLITDVTEMKNTEDALVENAAMLQGIFDNSPVSMNLKDTSGRYLLINKPYADWYGLTPEEIIGKKANEFFFDQPMAEALDIVERSVLETGETIRYEVKITDRDGTPCHRDVTKFLIKVEGGKSSAIGTIVIDITEHRKTEEHLLQAKEEAEIASSSKSEFLANISHELRTPLNSVIGFSDALKTEMFGPLGSDQNKEYVEHISRSGKFLLGLINNLLDLAKIEAGGLEIFEEVLDIRELINESQDMVSLQAEERAVAIVIDVQSNLPLLVADRFVIKQVLLNLLSNAIKFTQKGGTVTTRAQIDKDGSFSLVVMDDGIGISSKNIEKVLEPFTRGDDAYTRSKDGTGLGLSLVNSLVSMHGGHVNIESNVGVGTTVTVTFPSARVVQHGMSD